MTYVDERIVELKFDNKQFEQETAKTMSTLDKLKEKLSFKNASSGAEQLQKAVANINVNPIIQGIDTIETKMGALSVAGKRIVENLTDWAMSGINKIISKLNGPLNQIITGGKSRAQNIEQAKFQLEGLKVAWEDIQEDINYGVQDTAYGLDAAAKVASQLVASQVQLGDEMKHALLGISGVAAMTNSSYEDIGRIYTTVAGNGRLMGEQLLQLSTRGINAAAQLAIAFDTTESEIRDMVSKGEISFEMFSDAMFKAFGEHAKSANKTFQGALSNTKAALSRLGADVAAQGFNSIRDILNEIIPKLKDFKKAIKPVEDAIIKMVDSVGKLVQAVIKSIDINKVVDAVVPKIEKFINKLTGFTDAWREAYEITHKKYDSIADYVREIRGLNDVTEAVEEETEATIKLNEIKEDQIQMARDIWETGKYGNGQDRVDALKENYAIVQAYVDKMIELGWDEGKMNEYLAEEAKKQEKAVEAEAKSLSRKGLINNLVESFKNLKRALGNIGSSVKNVLSVIFSSFRDVFALKGSSGIGSGIVGITKALADFTERIKISKQGAEKLRPIFTTLFKIIKGIVKVIVTLVKGLVNIGTAIGNIISKIKNSSMFKKIVEAAKNAVDSISTAISKVWDKLKNSGLWDKFVDILEKIGHFLGEVLISALEGLGSVAGVVIGGVTEGFEWLSEKIGWVKDALLNTFPFLEDFGNFIKNDILTGSWLTKLGDLIKDIFSGEDNIFQKAYDFGHELVKGLIEGLDSITKEDIINGTKIAGVIITLGSVIKWLNSVSNLNDAISGMASGLGELCESITAVLKKYGKKLDAESFSLFADGIVKIVASVIALTLVMALVPGASDVAGQAAVIVSVLMAIYGVIFAVKAWMLKTQGALAAVTIKTARLQLAAMFIGIAALIYTVARSIKTCYDLLTSKDFNQNAFIKSLSIVAGSIVVAWIILKSMISQVEKSGGVLTLSGLAGLFTGLSAMVYVMAHSLKTISTLLGDENNHVWEAVGVLGVILVELGAFLGVLLAITKNNTVINNPFKGLFTLFLGITALLRLGLVPLLETIHKIIDEGDIETIELAGIIIGILSLLIIALMKLANDMKATTAVAMAAIPASIAVMLMALSSALFDLSTVNTGKLVAVAAVIGGLTAVILVLMIVLSKLAGGTMGLFAIAAVLIAIGAAAYLCAKAFEVFENTLENLVVFLITTLQALTQFFDGVSDAIDGLTSRRRTKVQAKINVEAEVNDKGLDLKGDLFKKLKAGEITQAEYEKALVDAGYGYGSGDDFVMLDTKAKGSDDYTYEEAMSLLLGSETGKIITEHAKMDAKAENDLYNEIHEGALMYEQLNNPSKYERPSTIEAEERLNEHNERMDILDETATKWAEADAEEYDKMYTDIWNSHWEDSELPSLSFGEGGSVSFDKDAAIKSLTDMVSGMNLDDAGISTDDVFGDMIGGYSSYLTTNNYELGNESWDSYISGFTDDMGNYDIDKYINTAIDADNVTSTFGALGIGSMISFDDGIESKSTTLKQSIDDILSNLVKTIRSNWNEFFKAGVYVSEGFGKGIEDPDAIDFVEQNMSDVVFKTKRALEKTAKIDSPSKVFAGLGKFVTLGFAEGISSLSYAAEEATEDVGEDSVSALRSILDRIFDTTMAGLDTNPVITPVLDLSELQNGLYSMNGMLDNNSSFGLAFGAANGYNRTLAIRNAAMDVDTDYDGTNVVEAIDGLRTDLANMQASLNTLGFYVDGKQMATAIANPMNKALTDISVRVGRGVE